MLQLGAATERLPMLFQNMGESGKLQLRDVEVLLSNNYSFLANVNRADVL